MEQSYLSIITLALSQAPLMRADPTENVYSLVVVIAQMSRLFPGHELLKKGLNRDFFGTLEMIKKFARLVIVTRDHMWVYVIGLLGIYAGALISIIMYPLYGVVLSLFSSLVICFGRKGLKASLWMWLIVLWQIVMLVILTSVESSLAIVTLALAQAPLMRSHPTTSNLPALFVNLAQFSSLFSSESSPDDFFTADMKQQYKELKDAAFDTLWVYVIGSIFVSIGSLISIFFPHSSFYGILLSLISALAIWRGTEGCRASLWMWLLVVWQIISIIYKSHTFDLI